MKHVASIFGFKSRDPARDKQTDAARFKRLADQLDQIAAEIEAERNGLRNRYRSKSATAAFLIEAMDDQSASRNGSAKVSELTRSILDCERRIAALSHQNEVMRNLRHSLKDVLAIASDPGGFDP